MNDERPSVQARILRAAHELFLTQGYNGSNLRDIAARAEVSMGGIYHHFASKEDIYETLLKRTELGEELPRLAALFSDPSFPENTAQIGRAIFDIAERFQDDFKLVYIDILEFQGRNIKPILTPLRESLGLAAASLLDARIARGEVADLSPALMLRVIVGLYLYLYLEDSMLELSTAEQMGMPEEAVVEQMAQILLHGMLRRS
jgi:AcrR family transcriptional regulator